MARRPEARLSRAAIRIGGPQTGSNRCQAFESREQIEARPDGSDRDPSDHLSFEIATTVSVLHRVLPSSSHHSGHGAAARMSACVLTSRASGGAPSARAWRRTRGGRDITPASSLCELVHRASHFLLPTSRSAATARLCCEHAARRLRARRARARALHDRRPSGSLRFEIRGTPPQQEAGAPLTPWSPAPRSARRSNAPPVSPWRRDRRGCRG